MKASAARRLAKNVSSGKITAYALDTEFDLVIRKIINYAGRGYLYIVMSEENIRQDRTIQVLRKLGYEVECIHAHTISRSTWRINWERKPT